MYAKQSAKVNVPRTTQRKRNIYLKLPYSKASHLTNDIVNETNQKISRYSIKINAVYITFKTKFLFRNKDKFISLFAPQLYTLF